MMSGLTELPIPQTREQCIAAAVAYAVQIKNSSRLKSLAAWRLKAKEQGAPDWFIKMVDVEVGVIIHRIAQLEGWARCCDPWGFASETMRFIYWAHQMLRQFVQPHTMEWHNTEGVHEWLQDIQCLSQKG